MRQRVSRHEYAERKAQGQGHQSTSLPVSSDLVSCARDTGSESLAANAAAAAADACVELVLRACRSSRRLVLSSRQQATGERHECCKRHVHTSTSGVTLVDAKDAEDEEDDADTMPAPSVCSPSHTHSLLSLMSLACTSCLCLHLSLASLSLFLSLLLLCPACFTLVSL